MFGFGRKTKAEIIAKYKPKAEEYLRDHLITADILGTRFSMAEPDARYSIDDNEPQERQPSSRPQYSEREYTSDRPKYSEREYPRYSARDNYDADLVDYQLRRRISNEISRKAGYKYALDDFVDQSFVVQVQLLAKKKGYSDAQVYKSAHMDRRLYSKIMSDLEYTPSKDTAIAIAFALQLTLTEAEDLLKRAGYAFSHSNKRDVILEFLFREQVYDLTDINIILDELGVKILGRQDIA